MEKQVNFSELMDTIEWVSAAEELGDAAAYVSRADGKIYWDSDASDEDLPDDLEDASRYARVPSKREMDLGSRLNFKFARRHLSADQEEEVRSIFRSRGAFARFKSYVSHIGRLQDWYDFRHQAEIEAVREWCESEGLLPPSPGDEDDDET